MSIGIIYLISCAVAFGPMANYVAWQNKYDRQDKPDGLDYTLGGLMALMLVWLWPAMLLGVVTAKLAPAIGPEKEYKERQKQVKRSEEIWKLQERDRSLGLEPWDYGGLK